MLPNRVPDDTVFRHCRIPSQFIDLVFLRSDGSLATLLDWELLKCWSETLLSA
jgi:hypothetical protein